jgi:hypothetical protein
MSALAKASAEGNFYRFWAKRALSIFAIEAALRGFFRIV